MEIVFAGGVLRSQRGGSVQCRGSHTEALQRTHGRYREYMCPSSGSLALNKKCLPLSLLFSAWPTYTVKNVSSGTPVCHWAGSCCRGRRLRSCPGLPIFDWDHININSLWCATKYCFNVTMARFGIMSLWSWSISSALVNSPTGYTRNIILPLLMWHQSCLSMAPSYRWLLLRSPSVPEKAALSWR